MAAVAPSSRRWIFGPASDLLLGCGLGYVLFALLMGVLPAEPRTLLAWGVILSLVTGTPHYGATLLRVYERSEDRRKYVFFGVWASLAVWATFVIAVYVPWIAAIFITVYITWSPWHYAGQNYGLAVMFLRRRGVPFTPATKRWIYASFILSYVMNFIAIHSTNEMGAYVPVLFDDSVYPLMNLGLPYFMYEFALPAAGIGYLVCLGVSVSSLWRRSSLRDLAPVLTLLGTHALWFVVAVTASRWANVALRADYVVFYFLWVGVWHSVQYLWITTYYAAGDDPPSGRARYYFKTLLAGSLIFVLPPLLFAPALLGRVPFQGGLWLLVGAAVNLQHFILDGAIWKLRDGPVARILLAQPKPDGVEPIAPGGGHAGLRPLLVAAGTAAIVINIGGTWVYHMIWEPAVAGRNTERAVIAEGILRAIGRSNPSFASWKAGAAIDAGELDEARELLGESIAMFPTAEAWNSLARIELESDALEAAEASYRSSIEARPSAEALTALGRFHERRGESAEAIESYHAALRVEPHYIPALIEAGRYWGEQGRPNRARMFLRTAAEIDPTDPAVQEQLARFGS